MHCTGNLHILENLTFSLPRGAFLRRFLEMMGLRDAVKGNVVLSSSYSCLWLLLKYWLTASEDKFLGSEGEVIRMGKRRSWAATA